MGKYLEQPVLHYTIGTPITKTMLDNLKKYGIKKVLRKDEYGFDLYKFNQQGGFDTALLEK